MLAVIAQELDVDQLEEAFDPGGLEPTDWAAAGVVMVVGVAVALLVGRLLRLAARRRGVDSFLADLIQRSAVGLLVVAALIYALGVLGVRIAPLLGALGIAGVALAFALKDTVENLVAGIVIQLRRPFRKGDEIVVGEDEGRVVEINGRSVVLATPDGRNAIFPARQLLQEPMGNLTPDPDRRTDLEIGIAYGSDLDRASAVLERAASEVEGVHATPAPEVLFTGFGESSIDLVVRYWHGSRIADFWAVRDRVLRACWRSLTDEGITIPFPQRTLSFLEPLAAEVRHGDASPEPPPTA